MYFKYPCLNTELHSVFTNFFQRITVIIICSEHEMHFKHSRMSIWFMIICDVSLHCLFFMAVFDCRFWSLVLTNSAVLQSFTSIIIFLHWSLWCKYTSCLHCASVCGKNTCISNGNFFFFLMFMSALSNYADVAYALLLGIYCIRICYAYTLLALQIFMIANFVNIRNQCVVENRNVLFLLKFLLNLRTDLHSRCAQQ